MISKFNTILLSAAMTVVSINSVFSQKIDIESQKSIYRQFTFLDYRGSNAIDFVGGFAMVEGDYPESDLDLYYRIGYKHHLKPHLSVSVSFNKYNIAIKDLYNEGYLSVDLNFEYLFSPYTRFSPFLYAGYGYNASNYFESTAAKAQGGIGFELIITEGIGLKLFGEYNYMFTDELDGLIEGETDDVLIRVGFGVNIYFGGGKKKEALRKKMKTVINSNLIIPYN